MAEGGIEVVAPHQHHDAATKPDAFGVAGRAVDRLLGLDKLVGLALVVLGSIRRIGIGRLAGLVLGADIAALGKGAADTKQKGEHGDRKVTQYRIFKLKHPSTHKFPGWLAVHSWSPADAPA